MKIIAVDFDGVLCENRYPDIGKENNEVIEELKKEKEKGTKLILWTCREGKELKEAIKWCAKKSLHFDAINDNIKERIDQYGNNSRKISADEYWDDKAVRKEFKL